MNTTLDLLRAHRSIRKFTDQPVAQVLVETIVQAGQAAATSSFIQACTVIQITDSALREQLAACAGDQAYVVSAPVFLVFCADTQRHRQACAMHGREMCSGYTEQFLTASLDCALFAQNCVVAAESMGLGTVYIGGLRNRIAEVSDALALPNGVYPVFGLCIGHPAQNPELKPRLPLSVVLKQNGYTTEGDQQALSEYDAQVAAYYRSRTGGRKDQGWTEQMAEMLEKEARPHLLAYLQQQGFLLR